MPGDIVAYEYDYGPNDGVMGTHGTRPIDANSRAYLASLPSGRRYTGQ